MEQIIPFVISTAAFFLAVWLFDQIIKEIRKGSKPKERTKTQGSEDT